MPPAFSIVQRLELERDLALTPEQVHELEVTALPMITAFVRRQPTKIDVRDELRATAKALKGAQRAILRLLGGTSVSDRVSPRDAALTRVVVASYEMGADGDVLDSTLSTLTAAIHVIEGALADLASQRDTTPDGFLRSGRVHRQSAHGRLSQEARSVARTRNERSHDRVASISDQTVLRGRQSLQANC
jgi:hypothetical protein